MSDSIYTPKDLGLEIYLAVQNDITARLQNDSFLRHIPCFSERKHDIVNEVNRRLGILPQAGQRGGVAIVVQAAVGNIMTPNIHDPQTTASHSVRVMENPIFNDDAKTGIGIPALVVVRRVIKVLHLYRPNGLAQNLVSEKPGWTVVDDPIAPVAYEVNFTAMEEGVRTPKTATPTLSNVSGTITLTAESGAETFYTTDGSYPGKYNPASRLYDGPFELGSALTLRWCAVKQDCIDSDTGILKT